MHVEQTDFPSIKGEELHDVHAGSIPAMEPSLNIPETHNVWNYLIHVGVLYFFILFIGMQEATVDKTCVLQYGAYIS